MFDIGFSELLLIAVLALLVLGPERLPSAVRTISLWLGRLRRSFASIRQEIEREVGADEIRRQLHNESVMASLKESKQKLQSDLDSAADQVRAAERSLTGSHADSAPSPNDDPSRGDKPDNHDKTP